MDKSIHLPADRGPFYSSSEMMMALAQLQIERMMNLSTSPADEYYSDAAEELAEDLEAILKTCDDLVRIIPATFPPSIYATRSTLSFITTSPVAISSWNLYLIALLAL